MRRAWLAAASVALGTPSVALAQSDGAQLEEIVVTATKRAGNLQDAPLSVTAFTAATIERQGITGIADIARRTPGLQYGDFGDVKLSPTSLRGIVGSAGSAGADPAVGYYVDEVFVGQGAGAVVDLYDIARVEVLRGPQGTLFGRNTIGGVISITTEKPSNSFKASTTLQASNYDGRRVGTSISGPIVPGLLSGKISTIYDVRDGTSHNLVLDRDVNDRNIFSARGQLAFDFGKDTDLLLTIDYQRVRQEPLMFETLKSNPSATVTQLLGAYGLPRNTDPYDFKVLGDAVTQEKLEARGLAATFNTRLGDVKVTNVASYRYHDYYSRTDTDRTPLSIAYDGDPEDVWRASEELRFDASTGPVDWLAGLYAYRQHSKNLSFIEVGSDLATVLGAPGLAGVQTGSNGDLRTTSLAAFVSATWHVTDRFELTAGGRYTRDRKKIHYTQSDPLGLLGGDADIRAKGTWDEFTPSFNAKYRVTPDAMLYVTANKGFKSGGFNDALGDADGIGFDPETLWNYEAGLKLELLDRRAVINLAAYYMDWSSIQLAQDDPRTPIFDPIVLNGGAAHSQGVEVEATFKPTARLILGGNLSIQEAEYDGGVLPDGTPLRRIPYAPDYTASLYAEQTFAVGDWDLTVLPEYVRRGSTYLTPNNDPDGRVSPYGLWNLRASLRAADGPWRLTIWGKNLGDKTYKTRLFDSYNQDLVGQKFIILGEPRTYGVELRVDF
jgi:iron complex outermembrane receptor protein